MNMITTKDGTQIYYKDLGQGPTGCLQPRVGAECRRMGGPDDVSGRLRLPLHRARPSWARPLESAMNGNDMDTYTDVLAALVEKLGLKNAVHVGHSTGGGGVARYIGRHGTKRVAKAALISAIPPLMLKTPGNPAGLPIEVLDQFRASVQAPPREAGCYRLH